MRPDPDMMRTALMHANSALDAIARFQSSVGFAFGADATHASAYMAVRELADALQSIGSKVHHVNLDADERLSPSARINKTTTSLLIEGAKPRPPKGA